MNTQATFPTLRPVLGAADLADALFGDRAKSSVITNWRARIADFPPERRKGELDLVAIYDWMQDNRREDLRRLEEEAKAAGGRRAADQLRTLADVAFTPLWWWAQSVRAYADAVTVPVARRELLALVLLAHLLLADDEETFEWLGRISGMRSPTTELADDLAQAIERLAVRMESRHEIARGLLVTALVSVGDRGTLVLELFRRLVDASVVAGGIGLPGPILRPVLDLREDQRRGKRPETGTNEALATLMAELGDVEPERSVLDPACGEGDLLVAAHARALRRQRGGAPGDLGGAVPGQRFAGFEISESVVATARTRLAIVDCPADVRHADFLEAASGDQRFDVVLLDPPMPDVGSRKLKPWMGRWLMAALRHVAPDGRVVMLLPNEVLPDLDGSTSSLLEELFPVGSQESLEGFRIEDVVLLPRRVRTDIDGGAFLVSLRVGKNASDQSRTGLTDLRSIDASDLGVAAEVIGWAERLSLRPLVDELATRLSSSPSHGMIHPEQAIRLRRLKLIPEVSDVGPEGSIVERLRTVLLPLLDAAEATAPEQAREARKLLDEVEREITSVRSPRRSRTTGGTS